MIIMEQRTYIFNQSRLTVKFGNIVDSHAEVVVSSDDSHVTMGGGVSRAIRKAGGVGIMQDAQKMTPVPLGDVIVTSAGDMEHQKYVFHCITIDRTQKLDIMASKITEDDVLNYILQHSVDKCFQLMQAMELTSIAFPTIGAGTARIPIQKVIEQMSEAIARNLSRTNRKLDVELYWFDIYKLCSESDIITLFENLASKAALVEYQQSEGDDETTDMVQADAPANVPAREDMHHKVFISYSRKDMKTVEYICSVLKENGIEYWIDKEGIYSSFNYKEILVDAIEVAKAVIFVSSQNSNASRNVEVEVGYAIKMERPVFPVMLDDAQFSKKLRLDLVDVDHIDFKNPASAVKKLITGLMYVLNK